MVDLSTNGDRAGGPGGRAKFDRDHARSMDRVYRSQRYIYDLTRKYYLIGRDRAIVGLDLKPGQSLLELGCGTGRNLLLAQRRYPEAQLFGLDISAEMLAQAAHNFKRLPRAPITRLGDATAFSPDDFGRAAFDRILISYALSMVPDWERAIAAAMAALAPGGSLHIVDFGQQADLPLWFRRGLHGWLARFHVTPRADLKAVLQREAETHGATCTVEPLARDYAWHAILCRPKP